MMRNAVVMGNRCRPARNGNGRFLDPIFAALFVLALCRLSGDFDLHAQASASEDKKILGRAMDSFRADHWPGARSEALKISQHNTPEGMQAGQLLRLMDAVLSNRKRREDVQKNLRKEDMDKACEQIALMEADIQAAPPSPPLPALATYFKDLPGLKAKAGGCAPSRSKLSPKQKDEFERALKLFQAKDYVQPEKTLKALQAEVPENEEVRQLLSQVREAIRRDRQIGAQERFDELIKSARQLASEGEFGPALEKLASAENVLADKSVKQLKGEIEQARSAEKAALIDGIDSFYAGEYAKAQEKLKTFLKGRHAEGKSALARFYLAASIGSEYFLSGAANEEKKKEAIAQFIQLPKKSPGLPAYPWNTVSPKLQSLYAESEKQTKQ